jgi:hypothetical protein
MNHINIIKSNHLGFILAESKLLSSKVCLRLLIMSLIPFFSKSTPPKHIIPPTNILKML